jgi:hypothetical protein
VSSLLEKSTTAPGTCRLPGPEISKIFNPLSEAVVWHVEHQVMNRFWAILRSSKEVVVLRSPKDNILPFPNGSS